jgi:serine phosphatase RsbU (regulator of sigma subunit)
LLCYTDGLVELPARTIDEGVARLQEVMAGGAGLPADELCSRLIASAPRRADDIALLLVAFEEKGEETRNSRRR